MAKKHKVKLDKGFTRIITADGLDLRIYGGRIEIEREGRTIGIDVSAINPPNDFLAPADANYTIRFYRPDTAVGASGKKNEVKVRLQGAVYVCRDRVLIHGVEPTKEFKTGVISYE